MLVVDDLIDMPIVTDTPTLRQLLRHATRTEHDRLDGAVTHIDLQDREHYRRFLTLQLIARRPIEQWLAAQSLPFAAPPPLAGLLVADLDELGGAPTADDAAFTPPPGADPLGACWAIAGSSLGNRAMHRTLLRGDPGGRLAARFLADDAMTAYWQTLKPILETPAQAVAAAGAVAAAQAVFASFIAAAERCLIPDAPGIRA